MQPAGSATMMGHSEQDEQQPARLRQYVVAASLLVGSSLPTARAELDDDLVAVDAVYSSTTAPGRSNNAVDDDDGEVSPSTAASSKRTRSDASSRRDLIEFLESLPISSVGQKHTALFECDLNEDTTRGSNFKLVWLKLVRNATTDSQRQSQPGDLDQNFNDITLLSIGKRTISPDKRFKVQHQPPFKWTLAIENVNLNDDKAYYLCQVGGGQSTGGGGGGGGGGGATSQARPAGLVEQGGELATPSGLSFIGGARLNVLVPPKIVENETSPNLVQVDEFGSLRLQCKVISEPQSQISWRREDGKSLDGLEQRFKHHIDRKPHRVVSIDSGELLFNAIRRDQAGAYLCIASNGVQPGVSQRISVAIGNCRQSSEPDATVEPCNQSERSHSPNGEEDGQVGLLDTGTSTSTSTTTRRPQQPPPKRANWTSSGGVRMVDINGAATDGDQQLTRRAQQQHRTTSNQTDKIRGSRYNQNRRTNQANQQRRLLEIENSSSSNSSSASSFQYSISATLALAMLVWMLVGGRPVNGAFAV